MNPHRRPGEAHASGSPRSGRIFFAREVGRDTSPERAEGDRADGPA